MGRIDRTVAKLTGAIYARYSTRHQDSVADQVRAMLDDAIEQGIYIPREFIFFDAVVIGRKLSRMGLDALWEVLRQRRVQVLLLFASNRLFRRAYEAYHFVDQVFRELRIRCRFVAQGVDTKDTERWEFQLTTNTYIDQVVSKLYVENIRSAHESLLLDGTVHGQLCYGYEGAPLEGRMTKRNKPRLQIRINALEATVVVMVFRMYVEERRSIAFIVAHLNALGATIPRPATESGEWNQLVVRTMLRNERYRGKWSYGITQSVFLPKADYRRAIARDKPLAVVQHDHLRIIDEDLWQAAQVERAKRGRGKGRKTGQDVKQHPKLLNGLLICSVHNRPLWTHGQDCSTYACRSCLEMKPDERPLFTHLNRELATTVVCRELTRLIFEDHDLVDRIIARCQELSAATQRPDPTETARLKKRLQELDRKIGFVLANPGETDEDRAQSSRVLRDLRSSKNATLYEVQRLEEARLKPIIVPTREDVVAALAKLASILATAATESDEARYGAARRLIERLTGGRIELVQHGERLHMKGWLEGHARTNPLAVVVEEASGQKVAGFGETEITFVFDRHQQLPPKLEEVKALFDQNLLVEEIAEKLDLNRNRVRQLLKLWHNQNSAELPNLWSRAKRIRASRAKQA